METENQNNQNSEALANDNAQKEKSTVAEKSTIGTDSVVKQQITNSEKEMMVALMADGAKKSTIDADTVIEQQITNSEKEMMVALMTDGAKKSTIDADTVIEQQISNSEKEMLVALMTDGSKKTSQKNDVKEIAEKVPVDSDRIVVNEISTTDKRAILGWIRDTMTDRRAVEQTQKPEEVNYNSLNKLELVEQLEEVVEEKDIAKIKDTVAKIKVAFYKRNKEEVQNAKALFLKEGGEEKDFATAEDPLEHRFKNAFSHYKQNKAKFSAHLEEEKQVNLNTKLEILAELKQLINSEETLKKTYDEFRTLQEKWKAVGLVPAGELNNLWQSYHFLVEKFFDKVRINKELRDLDLKKNMEAKIALCEKTEELLMDNSIINSFKLLQKHHDEWREIGPVPSDKKDALWERFKAATDKINERRREHYKELQEEQENNYKAKVILCENAEEVVNSNYETLKHWQNGTDKINELLKIWKTIGRAHKTKNDEVWERFKSSLDKFFGDKKEFLSRIKEQQINNYNLKIDLCVRAEALQDSEEWGKTTRDLIALQKDWKKIGPVPRKHSDKIWARFRATCDTFFNRKEAHFKNAHNAEEENLKLKKTLIEEVVNFEVKESKSENLNAVKDFQKRWLTIGHIPFALKDKIHKQYKDAFEKLLDKLNINNTEISVQNYKNHAEMVINSPEGERKLSHERYALSLKVKKMEEDIKLWENNIGFFSHSKQADVLKHDFEKKIVKAKRELQAMTQKIKVIDKMM